MLKRLMVTAALLAAVSATALAAQNSTLNTDHWLASDVYKASVYDPNNKIGDIDDLVINKDGSVSTAVIGVGGFLGVGQKDVAIPFTDLKVASNNDKTWFVLDRTKQDLKSAPAFDKSTNANQ